MTHIYESVPLFYLERVKTDTSHLVQRWIGASASQWKKTCPLSGCNQDHMTHLKKIATIFLEWIKLDSSDLVRRWIVASISERSDPLSLLGHIWDVTLVWRRGIFRKLSLCYSIVYYYNGAQRYEQFLQVSRLYRALILLDSAFYHLSSSVSLWCYIHSKFFWLQLSLMGLALDLVDSPFRDW